MLQSRIRIVVATAFALGLGVVANAADPTPDEAAFYTKRIEPLLKQRCYKCHSKDAKEIKGGLQLDNRNSMLDGGDSGSAVVPGDLKASLMIEAIGYSDDFYQMPPDSRLPEKAIKYLKDWIEAGAKMPAED
ncbi:MAG: hypothetical protein ACI9G1_003519 [Pirellulaceae bacterium]|jgi:hypothetical protein